MSRYYFIDDARGKRRINEQELPLRIGGKALGGIAIPGTDDEQLVAFIALSGGHAYIQPADDSDDLFHNNERLTDSSWLKSGDRIQISDAVLSWVVQGDKVLIDVHRQSEMHSPRPPQQAPPERSRPHNDDLPVHAEDSGHSSGNRRRKIFLMLASILMLVTFYLLMAVPVVIDVEPDPEHLEMKGFPPPLTLWDSQLVLPGHYIIEATKTGYVPLVEELEIKRGGVAEHGYQLVELPGLLSIKTQPETVLKLTVDETETAFDEQGRAKISRGQHQLRIETARFLAYQQEIDIIGYGREQKLELALQPAWAAITFLTRPKGAEVFVDGEVAGLTPLTTELLQGQHEIVLKKQGFKEVTLQQSVSAGIDVTMEDIQLQPLDGRLSLNSNPAGASILLDGEFQGTTPATLSVAANTEHIVKLSKAGFRTHDISMVLEPEQERSIEAKLAAEYGTIFLTTRPAGVTVEIDGSRSATASGRLRLTTRPHRLTVSKPGYASKSMNVTPRHGVSQNVTVNLNTAQQQAEQKKTAAMHAMITTAAGQKLLLVRPEASLNMGASRREAGRRANESQRLVKFKRPFYFSSNEVSNAEYRQFKASHASGSVDGAALNGEAQPVVNISWEDAARYCNWLSKQDGLPAAYIDTAGKILAAKPMTTGYRLPTEAEWSWVARKLGKKTEQRYPWQGGYPPTQKSGNFADLRIADTLADTVPGYDDGFRGTAPVASFPAWPAGFYDLGGNAAEWVHDYYAVYPGEATRMVTDPTGPVSGNHHLVRGSSWRHGNITELRLSYRDYSSKPRYDLGFRIARYAE